MQAQRSTFAWMLLLVCSSSLSAADVRTDVSTRETYVGLPIILQIHINNSNDHDEPVMPEVDGLLIQSAGPPSRSSRISVVNGRRTSRSTVTYSYRVTPEREGTFTIPPIKIVADRYSTITKAVRIVATKSETNDLLLVEIEGKEREIYVGQSLEMTLKVWVRPYRDKEFQITLDDETMWQLITDQTNWGVFEESRQQMAQDRQRPVGRKVLKEDSEGDQREYLLYEINATVYPDRPGQIDGDNVRIVMNYPVELGRSRSPFSMFNDDDFFSGSGLPDDSLFRGFGSRLGIQKSRPIVAEAGVDPVTVKPIPQQGRPDSYRGAVGTYAIITEAKPTEVKVGDPITLHIGIDGTGPMDVVRAPPLTTQENLIQDFKVPDEPLAGSVDGSRKVFSTTIRPLHDGVAEIPPIELSYFDPVAEKFVTTKSQPIAIEVEKADLLTLDAIVGGGRPSGKRTNPADAASDAPTAAPAIFSGQHVLRRVERPSILSSQWIVILLIPPLLALATLAFASRHRVSGFVSARRQFNKSVASAETPADIAEAVAHFLARRFHLDDGRLMRDLAVGRLRALGLHDLAIRAERLFASCEKADLRTPTSDSIAPLKDEAIQFVHDLGRAKSNARLSKKIGSLSTTSTVILAAALLPTASTLANEAAVPGVVLSEDQQRVVLEEAISVFSAAAETDDDTRSEEQFAKAADKFQLLVDSGIRNDQLYFNLASAQFRCGQPGRAIANYRRALRLAPTDQLYRANLRRAQQSVDRDGATNSRSLESIRRANDTLLRFVSPRTMQVLFLSAWVALWAVIVLGLLRFPIHWKSAALAALLIASATAGSYALGVSEFIRDDTAVLVDSTVSLREGDGNEFSQIVELSDAQGRVVKVLDRRSNWTRIGLDSGVTGWVADAVIEQI